MPTSTTEINTYYAPISDEMQEILRQNRIWYDSKGGEGRQAQLDRPDLSYTMLANKVFNGADFVQAKMQKSCFNSASFQGARLHGADFSGADLTFANFQGADLRGARFEQADLSYATFAGAILDDASFIHANLDGADFRGADLSNATFIGCSFPLNAVGGAKVNDKITTALLDCLAGLDVSCCSEDIRNAVIQINEIFTVAKAEKENKDAEARKIFDQFWAAKWAAKK